MTEAEDASPQQNVAEFDYYLPGMPRLRTSGEAGRFERFVTTLFGRRGDLRAVVRSEK